MIEVAGRRIAVEHGDARGDILQPAAQGGRDAAETSLRADRARGAREEAHEQAARRNLADHARAIEADHVEDDAADLGHAGGHQPADGRRGPGEGRGLDLGGDAIEHDGRGVVLRAQALERRRIEAFVAHEGREDGALVSGCVRDVEDGIQVMPDLLEQHGDGLIHGTGHVARAGRGREVAVGGDIAKTVGLVAARGEQRARKVDGAGRLGVGALGARDAVALDDLDRRQLEGAVRERRAQRRRRRDVVAAPERDLQLGEEIRVRCKRLQRVEGRLLDINQELFSKIRHHSVLIVNLLGLRATRREAPAKQGVLGCQSTSGLLRWGRRRER